MQSLVISFMLLFSMAGVGVVPVKTCSPSHIATGQEVDLKKMELQILQLINKHRASKKLAPLTNNEKITAAAGGHSRNMASGKIPFSHDGFNERVGNLRQAIENISSWAENVAFGQMSASEVVEGWLKSPGHRKNIEGDFNITGVGVARASSGELYFTQIFGKKG